MSVRQARLSPATHYECPAPLCANVEFKLAAAFGHNYFFNIFSNFIQRIFVTFLRRCG